MARAGAAPGPFRWPL
uniref:Uncharacterized protein n=1 Tax=Arundo donax TaxID=35708 RepID=A0A0A9FE53_ARUDO